MLTATAFVLTGCATNQPAEPAQAETEHVAVDDSEAAPDVVSGEIEYRATPVQPSVVDSISASRGPLPVPAVDYSGSDFIVLFVPETTGCELSVDYVRTEPGDPYVEFFFSLSSAANCSGQPGVSAVQVKISDLLFTTDTPMQIAVNDQVLLDGIPEIIDAVDSDYQGTLDWTQGWP